MLTFDSNNTVPSHIRHTYKYNIHIYTFNIVPKLEKPDSIEKQGNIETAKQIWYVIFVKFERNSCKVIFDLRYLSKSNPRDNFQSYFTLNSSLFREKVKDKQEKPTNLVANELEP